MSGSGEGSVPGFQTATCSPCAHMAFLQGMLSGRDREGKRGEGEREGGKGGGEERENEQALVSLPLLLRALIPS